MKNMFFLGFSWIFLCFPLDFFKGRISKKYPANTLSPPKNPPLEDFLCVGPCNTMKAVTPYAVEEQQNPFTVAVVVFDMSKHI